MAKPKHIRVGNEVMINDPSHPHNNQYAIVRDYDSPSGNLILELVSGVSGINLQFVAMPFQVFMPSNRQPAFSQCHVGDAVIVVNTCNHLLGIRGTVSSIKPVSDGLLYRIQEDKTGTPLLFYAEEIAPIPSKFLTGAGVANNTAGAITPAKPHKFHIGDCVVVDDPHSYYHGEIGFVVRMHPSTKALEVQMSCDQKTILVSERYCLPASGQPVPLQVSPNAPWLGIDPAAKEDEPDTFGVGQPKEKVFDHASLGTDLSGDELMKSIRDICGGH